MINKDKSLSKSKNTHQINPQQTRHSTILQITPKLNHQVKTFQSTFRVGKRTRSASQADKANQSMKTSTSVNQYSSKSIKTDNRMPKNQKTKIENGSKVRSLQSFRSLLPDYLVAKFPQKMAQLCNITRKIDQYLLEIKVQNIKTFSESFINVQSYLLNDHELSFDENDLQKINYIAPNFYTFWKDPLQNSVIVYPKNKSIHLRYQSFKKSMLQHYKKVLSEGKQDQQIPEKHLVYKKTQYFYEKKKFKKMVDEKKEKKNKICNEFVTQIIEEVNKKEQIQKQYEFEKVKITNNQILKMRKTISQIYENRKVSNIYRATLVQLVDQDTKYGTAKSMKGIEHIIKMSDLITQINSHPSSLITEDLL